MAGVRERQHRRRHVPLQARGFDALAGPTLFDALVNKWRLGIFRLIDAAAIGVLLVKFASPLADTWVGARLATLGRASLVSFSAHLMFSFPLPRDGRWTGCEPGMLVAGCQHWYGGSVAALFMVAYYAGSSVTWTM